jgi:hypothetical protein
MVEEMLAFRGIEVSHETIRQWALKFGQELANIIRRRLPRPGDQRLPGVARILGHHASRIAYSTPVRGQARPILDSHPTT